MTTETSYALTRPAYVDQSHLVVTDLPLVSNFYQSMLGLNVIEKSASGEILGVDGTPLLTLTTGKDVRVAPRNAAGLFHTAFLMPSRAELARWLRHAAHNNVVLDGASDHLVSEAIYLSDPEGNGIEIYADRAPSTWRKENGNIKMATLRMNIPDVRASVPAGDPGWQGAPDGSVVGHVHLRVGDPTVSEEWWHREFGFDTLSLIHISEPTRPY